MKFNEYKGLDLAQIAADVLGEWDARDTFHKSITTREGHPAFVFYEGPPSANGMPGIHHVMARTIKDVFCRYKTQQGYLVHRKAGWDTHGLPVELGVEKKLGITKEDIGRKISIEEYNRTCREAVMEFTGAWEDLTRKMGYWVNMDDPYITYDNKYIETLWWLLKQLFDKGLLYKGYTIQPYSPAAGTGLSTHELNQPGCYRDVKDTTCTAQFRIIRDAKSEKLFGDAEGPLYFLAWTTTPWTLPSNTALAVGPAIEYVKVKCRNPYTDEPQTVILAKDLVASYFTKKIEGSYQITGESWMGPELEGIRYEQLIPWVKPTGDAFRVIVGDVINKGPIDFYDNMPYVFKCSKINLNITLRSIKSGIPLRCMDIMGAGGFLLTNYQADFLEYFTPDKDFVYYESIDDLIRKCDYYIKHEDERKAIALNGYNKVKEFHNYKVRLNDIFKIAGLI